MLALIAVIIFTVSISAVVIARHSLNEELFKIFSSNSKEANEEAVMSVVYGSTIIGYLVVLAHESSSAFSSWTIFSLLPSILLLVVLVRNILKGVSITNTSFFKNKVANFIVVDLSMYFIYLFTLMKLGIIFWNE